MTTPTVPMQPFVVIPRAVCTEALWGLPFSALLAKAERGEQGLTIIHLPDTKTFSSRAGDAPLSYMRREEDDKGFVTHHPTVLRDVAVFRGGQGDKTFLHGQGW